MKIICAITNAEIVKLFYEKIKRKVNILISYYYIEGNAYKLTTLYRDMIDSLYMDSGAYSVAMGKSKISLTEYQKYLKRYGHLFNGTFNLDDKFDDPAHNMRNQLFLQKNLPRRLWPIPVTHDKDDPVGEFKTYVDLGHDYIAMGSLGPKKKFDVDTISEVMKKFPNIKVHLFGNLDRDILFKCRPYSADSADFGHHAGHGSVYYWDSDEEKEYSIYLGGRDRIPDGHIDYQSFVHRKTFDEQLYRNFQYEYIDLLNDSTKMLVVNIFFFTQLEDYLNSLQK
ncbi:MAG: hypothetical protein ACLQBC_10870 [Syntrophales bacterium]